MGAIRLPYVANLYIFLDFWGPVSNFGIPIAAVMDTQKSPDLYASPSPPSRARLAPCALEDEPSMRSERTRRNKTRETI